MQITIPELSLVLLVGASGSGKSTFARRHFRPTEVLSSDVYRGLVSDDENEQSATVDAFEALHYVAGKRLARGNLAVVDATNVQPEARKPLIALARQYHVVPVAIVFNLPEQLCHERNQGRPDRAFGPHVVRGQTRSLRRSLGSLRREGFRRLYVLSSQSEIDSVEIVRERLREDLRALRGPFDVVGDIHGCYDELVKLIDVLGYERG